MELLKQLLNNTSSVRPFIYKTYYLHGKVRLHFQNSKLVTLFGIAFNDKRCSVVSVKSRV